MISVIFISFLQTSLHFHHVLWGKIKKRWRLSACLKAVSKATAPLALLLYDVNCIWIQSSCRRGFLLPTFSAPLRQKTTEKWVSVTVEPAATSPLVYTGKESTSESGLIDLGSPFSSVSSMKETKLNNLMNTVVCGSAGLLAGGEHTSAMIHNVGLKKESEGRVEMDFSSHFELNKSNMLNFGQKKGWILHRPVMDVKQKYGCSFSSASFFL